MLVFPFEAPPGFRWILTAEYMDPATGKVTRAADHQRKALCLLVAIGSTIL